jgi:hypothetical protein
MEGGGKRVSVKVALAPIGLESFKGQFQKFPVASRGGIGLSTPTKSVCVIM